jgi:hypothetical protein
MNDGGAGGKLQGLHDISLDATFGRDAHGAQAGRNRVRHNSNVFALLAKVEPAAQEYDPTDRSLTAGSRDLGPIARWAVGGLTGLSWSGLD